MAQQTAVEWLVEQLIPKDQHEGIMDIIEDAKHWEKEQIKDSYEIGWVNGDLKKAPRFGKEYYEQTFNK